MNQERSGSTRLRGVLLAALGVAAVADVVAWSLTLHHVLTHPEVPRYGYWVEGVVGAVPLFLVTLLLVRRRPEHRITWLFVAITVAGSVQSLTGAYAHESLAHTAGLPAAHGGLFVSSIAQFSFVIASMVLFHLFPTGRPAIGRLGWLLRAIVPVWVVETLVLLTRPRPFQDDPTWGHVPGPLDRWAPVVAEGPLAGVSAFWLVLLVSGVVHLVLRFRRSVGVERQQMRWFVAAVLGCLVLLAAPLPPTPWLEPWAVGPTLIWLSVGIAILRYRLYDLDRIVSRTLAYAVVLALLVGVYAVGVLGVGALVPGERSDLVVAASTLAAAALFQPLTTRVRRVVDRRFNRARYDAAATLAAFGARLRDEVDLESVRTELASVVGAALLPSATVVWLTPPRPARPHA